MYKPLSSVLFLTSALFTITSYIYLGTQNQLYDLVEIGFLSEGCCFCSRNQICDLLIIIMPEDADNDGNQYNLVVNQVKTDQDFRYLGAQHVYFPTINKYSEYK